MALAMGMAGASLHAQTDPDGQPQEHPFWNSAYVMAGASWVDRMDFSLADMRTLANGSRLLEADLEGYAWARSWEDMVPMQAFSAVVGFQPFRKGAGPGPELRLGVQYAGGRVGGLRYDREVHVPYDTLVSAVTGAQYIVDSVAWSRYSMDHRAERIGVDASLIFRTAGRSRWSLHGGVGLGFGAMVNARTSVEHALGSRVGHPDTSWREDDRDTVVVEDHRNAGASWFAAAANFGLGFRLARKGDFLRRMDLFGEFRPQMLVTVGDALGGTVRFGGQWMFGLRVRLHDR